MQNRNGRYHVAERWRSVLVEKKRACPSASKSGLIGGRRLPGTGLPGRPALPGFGLVWRRLLPDRARRAAAGEAAPEYPAGPGVSSAFAAPFRPGRAPSPPSSHRDTLAQPRARDLGQRGRGSMATELREILRNQVKEKLVARRSCRLHDLTLVAVDRDRAHRRHRRLRHASMSMSSTTVSRSTREPDLHGGDAMRRHPAGSRAGQHAGIHRPPARRRRAGRDRAACPLGGGGARMCARPNSRRSANAAPAARCRTTLSQHPRRRGQPRDKRRHDGRGNDGDRGGAGKRRRDRGGGGGGSVDGRHQ